MRNICYKLFLMIGLLQAFVIYNANAQQRFPVTASATLTPPYSPYLSDYISPGSNALRFNFVFNDFHEPSWQVRLKIRIESSDLKLETRADFRPATPITVSPGVSVPISADALAEYLDFKNLTILGGAAQSFLQNGRFPEGNYSFCLEVLDYPTGVVLSNMACASAWIRLNDPPRVISPLCGAFIDPAQPLNIPLQWQLANSISPNSSGTQYKIIIYELTDPYANPFTSIVNGKVLPVFESDVLTVPTFNYTVSQPALDVGKTYVYQIKAIDAGGRDVYKNNGLSETCWFHYGYPENARTTLITPEPEKAYRKSDQPYFRWSAPDLKLKNQPFSYELKIVVLDEGQDATRAIEDNPAWYLEQMPQTLSDRGLDHVLRKTLKPAVKYAWQVTTYSATQMVAKSEVRTFIGPPLVEKFYAGRHTVVVEQATSNDSLNFSGTGKFRVGPKDSIEVSFDGLRLRRIVNYWVLDEGNIDKDYQPVRNMVLQPRQAVNGTANFYARTIRLSKEGLYLQGEVHWALPHPVNSGEVAYVKSERTWLNYDNYKLLGSAPLSSQNQFQLLEPYNFTLHLNTESDFLISNDQFELRAEGSIVVPEKVKTKLKGKTRVNFPRTLQLYTIEDGTFEDDVALIDNVRIYLHPVQVTIDLSEETSPGTKSDDTFWKGIYMHSYELHYNSFVDRHTQLKLKSDIKHVYGNDAAEKTNCWIDSEGLNLKISRDFNKDAVEFNTFDGTVNHIEFEIEKNQFKNGVLTGGILIPVFSESSYFTFIAPITAQGFQPGYLNEFENKTYPFNKNAGEQEIHLTVKRGVFADQRYIDMVIDMEWPALQITAKSITGFKAWGDYKIGFYTPNGTRAFDTQLNGTLSGYKIIADGVAAGSNSGLYSFAISAKALLGEDVSGNNGPPSINVYTIMPNKWVPQVTEGGEGMVITSTDAKAYVKQVQEQYEAAGRDARKKLAENEQDIKAKANATLAKLTAAIPVSASVSDATADISSAPMEAEYPLASSGSGGLLGRLNPEQQEIVREIIETIVTDLTRSVTQPIHTKADEINRRINDEIDAILAVATSEVDDKVSSLVGSIAHEIGNVLQNDKFDVSPQIDQLAQITIVAVTSEVNGSIQTSVDKNIAYPITSLIKVELAGTINAHIRETAVSLVIDALEGKIALKDIPEDLLEGTGDLIEELGEKLFEQINFSSISAMAYNTVNDAIRGINTDRIYSEIRSGAEAALLNKGQEIVTNAAQELIGNAIGIEIPVNFATIASKLKDGDVKGIFALDPVPVKLKTNVLELNGLIHYQDDEPTYGDVWLGDIDVTIKVPKPFTLKAVYITGKKDEVHYWFAQVSPSDGQQVKLGGAIPRKARELKDPINMGVAKIVAVSGRVYNHMKDGPEQPIVPDPTNKYGAYLNLVFFDGARNGKTMRLDVAGEINAATNGNYVIQFSGDVQLMNEAPTALSIDPNAAVKGEFSFTYNSAEQHFLGYGRVELRKPGRLCASGSILVDTKPGQWRVEIGNRDDRIQFVPFCAGWSPTGWLAVTQDEAELGLGVQYSIYAKTPDINFVVVKANVALDAGIAFGVVVGVRYNPDFALLRAGLWVDLWADILINYKKPAGSWKSYSVLSIYAKGDLLLTFEPKPTTLEGRLKGHVRLLSIVTIDFDADFKKEIS